MERKLSEEIYNYDIHYEPYLQQPSQFYEQPPHCEPYFQQPQYFNPYCQPSYEQPQQQPYYQQYYFDERKTSFQSFLQTDNIPHNLEEPSLEELVRQLMINTMKSEQSIDASLLKLEEKASQLARQVEDIAKNFDDTCATCVEMNKCILSDDMICNADADITTPTLSNESECIDATIPIVFYVDPVDLQVVRTSEPLPTNVQPPLMEEKSLLNQEALDSMTHADKNHFVHHINTEDENVLELLGDFNFSNPVECIEDEIDELLNALTLVMHVLIQKLLMLLYLLNLLKKIAH